MIGATRGVQIARGHASCQQKTTHLPVLGLAEIDRYASASIITPTLHRILLLISLLSHSYLFLFCRLRRFLRSGRRIANRLDEVRQVAFEEMRHRLDDVQHVLLLLALFLIPIGDFDGEEDVQTAVKVKHEKTVGSRADIQQAGQQVQGAQGRGRIGNGR